MKKRAQINLDAPSTKRDLEDTGAHIVGAIAKTLEEYATKDDIKSLAVDLKRVEAELKADIKRVEGKVDDRGREKVFTS